MELHQQMFLEYIRTKFKILSSLSKRKAAEQAFALFCTPQHRTLKTLSPIFEKATPLTFTFLQYRIQGYQWNKEGQRKVVLLHGFESAIVNFDHYIKPLTAKGYCVLGFDAPAHGRSTGKRVNVLIYKQFIETIISKYGPIECFIAHSFGGLALALTLEQLQHNDTWKAVFIAPATETVTAINHFFNYLQLDKKIRNDFDKIIEEQSGHLPSWFSIQRAAPHIKARVLWLHDRNDYMTPLQDAVKIKEAAYPNFEFVVTEGLGHSRIYRDKNVMQRITDFL